MIILVDPNPLLHTQPYQWTEFMEKSQFMIGEGYIPNFERINIRRVLALYRFCTLLEF